MSIIDEGNRLREEIVCLGAGQRRRYPARMKAEILGYIDRAKCEGITITECCRRLGVSDKQLGKWRALQRAAQSRALVPVEVMDEPRGGGLAVISRTGFRVEGATMAQVIEMMRALA